LYKLLQVEHSENGIFDAPVYHEQFLFLVESEVTRLNETKQAKIASLTLELQEDIKRLWDKCFYGDEEKKEFALFDEQTSNTDENYIKLLQYSNMLNDLYKRNRSIFETAANWKITWGEYIDFEKKYSDPNRFKQKDYRSLYESNKRKELTTHLGSLIKSLNIIAAQHNVIERQHAVMRCLSFIKTAKDKHEQQKQEEWLNKKHSASKADSFLRSSQKIKPSLNKFSSGSRLNSGSNNSATKSNGGQYRNTPYRNTPNFSNHGSMSSRKATPTSNSRASSQVTTANYGSCSNKKSSGFQVNSGTIRPKPGASRKVTILIKNIFKYKKY
jgi:hypothetical protein